MTDKEFFEKSLEVSTEFDRLVLAHEEIARKIPDNALIIFELEDDPEFTAKSREISLRQREPGQPVIKVKIKIMQINLLNLKPYMVNFLKLAVKLQIGLRAKKYAFLI